LRVLTIADAPSAPPRVYLLHGLMAPGELSVWWGAPKCGKSFLLLRLAYGLALGTGMWSRAAKPCRVLYVPAEGEGGFAAVARAPGEKWEMPGIRSATGWRD
jgi:RecA-family ATPase